MMDKTMGELSNVLTAYELVTTTYRLRSGDYQKAPHMTYLELVGEIIKDFENWLKASNVDKLAIMKISL